MSDRLMASAAPRLAVIADSAATSALVRAVLGTTLPGVETQAIDPAATMLALEQTDCVVIDTVIGGASGISLLRRIRAGGYGGAAIVLIESADATPPGSRAWRDAQALGARALARAEIVPSLGTAVADAIAESSTDSPTLDEVRAALRRSQRLMAAGEIALDLQHAMNNPLGALLAEAQLLEMEPLGAEQRASVARIVELLRRVIALVRQLDGIAVRRREGPGQPAE